MTASNAGKSIREIRDLREKSVFAGRDGELALFLETLSPGTLDYPVVTFHGMGGVGKSALLRQYRLMTKGLGVPMGVVDVKVVSNVPEILLSFREQLGGKHFGDFDRTIKRYQETQRKLEDSLDSIASGVVSGVREGIPLGLGALVVDSIGEERIKGWLRQYSSEDDADLFLNADAILTNRFVDGLNRLAEQCGRVVIAFDTYEEAPPLLDRWLSNEFLTGDITSNALLIVAGRNDVAVRWHEWRPVIKSVKVECLTEDEAREFLAKRELFLDEGLIGRILDFTRGLPLALVLVADSLSRRELGPLNLSQIPHRHDVGRAVVLQFVRSVHDPIMQNVLETGAVFRFFDEDAVAHVMSRDDIVSYIGALSEFGFVYMRDDGKWSLHDVMREFIAQDIRRRSEATWAALNWRAVEFYEDRLRSTRRYGGEWRKLALERLYHLLWVDEERGINLAGNYVLSDANLYSGFRKDVARLIEAFPIRSAARDAWLMFFDFQVRQTDESTSWLPTTEQARRWLDQENVRVEVRARLAQSVGEYYRLMGRWEEATEYLEKSLDACRNCEDRNLSETVSALVMHNLAHICRERGQYGEALNYIQDAEKLFTKLGNELGLARVINNKGQLYRQLLNWDIAIECHSKSLALCQRLGDKFTMGRTQVYLGQVYLSMGDLDDAESFFLRAEKLFEEASTGFWQKGVLAGRILICIARQKWEEAEKYLRQGLSLARFHEDKLSTARGLYLFSVLSQKKGERRNAQAFLEEAEQLATDYGYHDLLARLGSVRAKGMIHRLVGLAKEEMSSDETILSQINLLAEAYVQAMTSAVLHDHFVLEEIVDEIESAAAMLGQQMSRKWIGKLLDRVVKGWEQAECHGVAAVEMEKEIRSRNAHIIGATQRAKALERLEAARQQVMLPQHQQLPG